MATFPAAKCPYPKSPMVGQVRPDCDPLSHRAECPSPPPLLDQGWATCPSLPGGLGWGLATPPSPTGLSHAPFPPVGVGPYPLPPVGPGWGLAIPPHRARPHPLSSLQGWVGASPCHSPAGLGHAPFLHWAWQGLTTPLHPGLGHAPFHFCKLGWDLATPTPSQGQAAFPPFPCG